MGQHAKGPWDVNDARGFRTHASQSALSVTDADGLMVATVAAGRTETADARLIAAAPGLLAACEAMRDCLMRFPSRAWIALPEGEPQKINGALDHAVEAIRAATGEGE